MKTLFLASIIAVTSAFSFGVPAQAASATVRTYHSPHYGRYHAGPNCYVKRVRHYNNGRVVYRNVRVCR